MVPLGVAVSVTVRICIRPSGPTTTLVLTPSPGPGGSAVSGGALGATTGSSRIALPGSRVSPAVTPPTTARQAAAVSAAAHRRDDAGGGRPTPASSSACWSSMATWPSSCSMTAATSRSDSDRLTSTVRSSGTHSPSAPSRSAKQMVTPRSAASLSRDGSTTEPPGVLSAGKRAGRGRRA